MLRNGKTNAEIGGNITIFHWVSITMFIPIHMDRVFISQNSCLGK